MALPQKLHNPLDESWGKKVKQRNFSDAETETILRAAEKKAAAVLRPHKTMIYGRRS